MAATPDGILALIDRHYSSVLTEWLDSQKRMSRVAASPERQAEVTTQSTQFLDELRHCATSTTSDDITGTAWAPMRAVLENVSRARALQGYSPAETATFVFSLKQPLFRLMQRELGRDADRFAEASWKATQLLDGLGLYTIEAYQKTREEVIARQQQELLELSTPVVQLWEGILALPLIGTLDSARTQIVMENLLEQIVARSADIAIIDITGVPTVDTLVAQHLIKTISAARLMGADCIISGIRPQIAQTIVHLGLELNVVSKATMADALALALRRSGKAIVDRSRMPGREA
ncbi:MAG TPA: STAS domain-containing protein [Acetobacteraceae bacterium]